MQDVHDTAMSHFANSFPAMSKHAEPDPWQQNVHTLNKWKHRQILHDIKARTSQGIFHAWFHAAQFLKLTRSHRRFAKQLRRQRFEETLQQANHAATHHDTHKLFDIINRFAPKVHRRRVQLRREDGTLMTSSEERSMLVEFIRTTWRGPPMEPMICQAAPGVPFTVSELSEALRLIPSQKATAAPCAPGIVWNSLAEIIAPVLHATLNKWWGQNPPWIPRQWRAGWLQLIPKPSKPPTRPQNLRPLALQCPVGKAILGLLIQKAVAQADAAFRQLPLWAFMRGRSTQDPLLHVAKHCRDTRTLIQSQRSTPHSRAISAERWTICGGIQVFLDLEKAFDCINRVKLFSKLATLGVNEQITQLLQNWHIDTQYIISHGGECAAIDVSRGLRQGCKGAPFLWNCLMVLMLQEMQHLISLDWLQRHLAIYADDCHISGTYKSMQEFDFLLQAIGTLFSLLQEFDLTLNPNKSVAILAMHGPKSRKTKAACVKRDHRGDWLKIPTSGQTQVLIPLSDKATYLGCTMSYQGFEGTTTWHRVKLAHIAFLRLRRWLCNRNHFSLQHRISLWRSCILPIMTYGVFAVGVTPKGVQHMFTQIGTMLRRIAGDHAHRTRHNNAYVFEKFALPRPADLLSAAVDTLKQSVAQRDAQLEATDVALQLDWTHLEHIHVMIHKAQAAFFAQRAETADTDQALDQSPCYFCNMCHFCTNSITAFRRHCTVCHGFKMQRQFAHPMHLYTTDGLPKCKHCGILYSSWRSFRHHIERGCQALIAGPDLCTGVPAALTMTALNPPSTDVLMRGTQMLQETDLQLLMSKPWGNRLLQFIADGTLDQLAAEREACGYLSRYCCLCGQHLNRTQDVHLHFRTEHAQYWDFVPQKSKMLTNVHSSETPCPHCGGYFRSHQCPVWTQVAVLMLHGGGLHGQESAPPEVATRCDICLQPFQDVPQLLAHLRAEHKLEGFSFNAARDCLNAEAKCAHCGAEYSSLEGLRSHIAQSRCSKFGPFAATEVAPISQAVLNTCLHGKMFDQLRTPMERLRLTTKCLHCQQAYQRAGDLANHLMNNHSRLWRQSQHLLLMLVDIVFSRHGCTCNPQIHQLRQNHICLPLRQIAMMYYRLDSVPFMPVEITEQVIAQMLHSSIPRELRFKVSSLFANRAFHDLWTNTEVTQLLRRCCMQCGQDQPAGLLCRHIHEAHLSGHRFVEFYIETLVPAIMKTLHSDYKCGLCNQVFNLPPDATQLPSSEPRTILVQTHLKGNCPVVLQSATLLAIALHGGRLGYEWNGPELPGPNPGDLSVPGSTPGSRTEVAAQSEGAETTSNQRHASERPSRSRSTRSRPAEAAAIPPGAGPASATSRAQLELAAKHRLFHSVFSAGQGGLPSEPAGGDSEMASAAPSAADSGADNLASAPMPEPSTGHAEPGDEGVPMQAGGCPVQTVPEEESPHGGHELAFPAMGHGKEDTGGRQKEGHNDAEDVGAPAGIGGGVSRPSTSGSVSGVGDNQPANRGAMETATELALPQGLRPAPSHDPFIRLDGCGDVPEESHPTDEWTGKDGPNLAAQRQGTWQGPREVQREEQGVRHLTLETRQLLCQHLAMLKIGNDSTWCFANAMMYSLLWALLCHLSPDFSSWGPHSESLHGLLLEPSNDPILPKKFPWFLQLLECWGMPQAQQDCGEFVHATLTWLAAPAANMCWERRLEMEGRVQCQDTGHVTMPLVLQFTPALAKFDTCTFQQLLHVWHQAAGMRAALLQAAPIICVQVDRMFEAEDGRIQKSSCAFNLEAETRFPVFCDDKLQCAQISYTFVAAAAHMGIDEAGHYQAFLKISPALESNAKPVQWLVTDDHVQPAACWRLPMRLCQNLTVAWFVRTDCLFLPRILQQPSTMDEPNAKVEDMTQLLALFREPAKDWPAAHWMRHPASCEVMTIWILKLSPCIYFISPADDKWKSLQRCEVSVE